MQVLYRFSIALLSLCKALCLYVVCIRVSIGVCVAAYVSLCVRACVLVMCVNCTYNLLYTVAKLYVIAKLYTIAKLRVVHCTSYSVILHRHTDTYLVILLTGHTNSLRSDVHTITKWYQEHPS